jgi:transposase
VDPEPDTVQNLCADAGYAGKPAEQIILEHGFVPHVRSRKDEKASKTACPGYKPRRWVVEVSHSWFTRFRKLLVRFEKKAASSLALHQLAAAIIVFRKVAFLYGPYKKSGI